MLFRDITLLDCNYEARSHQNVLVRGEKIVYAGPEMPSAEGELIYDGRGRLLVPGFFNMHCHVPMTLLRGYGEGLPLRRWLTEKMFPFEATLTPEEIYWGALLGIAEMVAGGTVSFTDMYLDTDRIFDAVEESGIKANLSSSAMDPARSKSHYRELPAFAHTKYLMDRVRAAAHDRIHAEVAIHAEYTTTERIVSEAAAFAAENKMSVHLHLSETEAEHAECRKRHGLTPAAWFDQMGAFEVPVTAAHCVWLEEADMALLADRGVTAVNCPSSNLKLGSGIAEVERMRRLGIRVAVGTDGAASNNNLDMLEEINLASLLQKGYYRDPVAADGRAMLQIACATGAAAQRRPDCGSIRAGNRADLTVVDLWRPHLQPVHDPTANLLYSARSSDIVMTMVDGRILYKDGDFLTIDVEKVMAKVKEIVEKRR